MRHIFAKDIGVIAGWLKVLNSIGEGGSSVGSNIFQPLCTVSTHSGFRRQGRTGFLQDIGFFWIPPLSGKHHGAVIHEHKKIK